MRLSDAFLYVSLICLGIICGVFFSNYEYFSFEKEISFFDLFSLAITTFLGIYITVRIGRVLNKENSEKQLLIDQLRESIKTFDEISKLIERRTYSIIDIVKHIKVLNENLHLVEELAKSCHCKEIKFLTIRSQMTIFRRSVTSVSGIHRNVVQLSTPQFAYVKRESTKLKQIYFELIFAINKI